MSEFFEVFNPGSRHAREEKDFQKVHVVQARRAGRGPQPLDLDSGRITLVRPGEQAAPEAPLARLAEPGELERAARITVRAYLDGGEMRHDDPYLAQLRDTAARAEQAELWVAVDGGAVVGTVTWCPPGSVWREEVTDDEATFRMLAVDPQAQGRGVGRLLVDTMLARATDDGFASVAISSAWWMTTAHAMYRSMGFERVPERDWSVAPNKPILAFRKSL